LTGVVMDVADSIAVWNSTDVKHSIVREANCPWVQYAAQKNMNSRSGELSSRNMASKSALAIVSRSGASRRGRQVTGEPVVVRMCWTLLWRTSSWTPVGRVRSGNSDRMLSTAVPPLMTLTLGIPELEA
jgi:hypothetical protein